MRSGEFLVEQLRLMAGSQKQETVHPREVTVDTFPRYRSFNLIYGSSMTRSGNFRALFAMDAFQLEKSIILRARQVGRRSFCLAGINWSIVNHHHLAAFLP
jgi:hypothetical protein